MQEAEPPIAYFELEMGRMNRARKAPKCTAVLNNWAPSPNPHQHNHRPYSSRYRTLLGTCCMFWVKNGVTRLQIKYAQMRRRLTSEWLDRPSSSPKSYTVSRMVLHALRRNAPKCITNQSVYTTVSCIHPSYVQQMAYSSECIYQFQSRSNWFRSRVSWFGLR